MIRLFREHGLIAGLLLLKAIQTVEGAIASTTAMIVLNYTIIIVMLFYIVRNFAPGNKSNYRIIGIYLLWMLTAGAIRGGFVAETREEMMDLITGIALSTIPIIAYVMSSPKMLWKTLHLWIWFALPLFIVYYSWKIPLSSYQFFFGPMFLICFIPILPNKWKIILSVIVLIMFAGDFGARSQSLKAAVVILICMGYYFRRWIPVMFYHAVHWLCYIGPVIILYFAITGVFNPLEKMEDYQNDALYEGEEDLTADTRSYLYEETIQSAVKNDYIWCGRSLARGNDSWVFEAFTDEQLKTKRYERYGNEWCHPNVFTWLGLIGVILYALMYLTSSYLALYKSNNIWMKFLSLFIAYNWMWGWLENCLEFNILNIGLWMMIAMGFSEEFRAMSDKEIETWVKSLFKWKYEKDSVAE